MKIPVLFSFILVSVSGSLLSFGGCGSKSKTNEGEASVAAKNDKAEGRANTEVNNEVVEAAASTVSGDTTDTSAIDISRPETFTAYGTGLGTDGVELKTLHPGTGIRATRVLDNGVKVWEGSGKEKCQTVEFYSKGGSKLLRLLIVVESSYNTGHVYYEHVNEKWKNIKKGVDFDNKLEELKKSENNLSITPGQESLEQEESLEVIPTAPDFKSKLDSTLLIVREYTVDGLFYLTCTPNSNTKVEKLKYDGTEIWSGSATIKKSSNLVDAMIYFDDNAPALIVIHTIKGDERSTVYRYHDGKQWKDTKEDDHKEKLAELKEKCKPGKTLDISKRDSSVGSYYITYPGYGKIAHNFDLKSATVTKVVDGEHVIWTAKENGHKCIDAKNIVTGGKESLRLEIKADKNEDLWFRKRDGKWTIIPQSNSRA